MSDKSDGTFSDAKNEISSNNESEKIKIDKTKDDNKPSKKLMSKKGKKPSLVVEKTRDGILESVRIHEKAKPDSATADGINWKLLINYYEQNALKTKKADSSLELYWLTRLGECYLKTEKYLEFAKLYTRLIKINNQLGLDELSDTHENSNDAYREVLSNQLTKEISDKIRPVFGNNHKLIQGFVDAINYAQDDEPCLIVGETGTGKEIIAELIHELSHRKENKFIKENTAGYTESLYNSEIRGVLSRTASEVDGRLGTFLNACGKANEKENDSFHIKGKEVQFGGKPISVNNPTKEKLEDICGTIFLDEINSLPMAQQSGLLRIIQEKEVKLVGDNKPIKFAAKVICATNKEITGNETVDGFREDLYYRISRGIIFLPALREMADSIPSIAKQIINNKLSKLIKNNKIELSKRAADKLMNYHWPGNHRELENVLYRALKKMVLNNDQKLKFEYIDLGRSLIADQKKPEFFEGKDLYQVNKMFVDYLLSRTRGNKTEAMRLGGFRYRKHILEILEPKGKYQSTRFKNCKSLPE
jgi:two-component system, NtrC family, response regulator HydG